MCGIIGAFNKDGESVNSWIVDQFEEQHSRGKEGFGIVNIKENKEIEVLRSTEPAKFMFDLHKEEHSMMLVHHRMPTSSPNYLGQTHPILVDNGSLNHKYLVVHNGVINNSDELKDHHEKELGFIYSTAIEVKSTYGVSWQEKYNDSESLAIEVARFIEDQSEEVGALGSAAFIAIQIDKETNKAIQVFFGRNMSNPLHMSFTRGKLRLSSEGEGENIKEDTLYSWDFESPKLKKRKLHFAIAAPKPAVVGFTPRYNSTPVYSHTHIKSEFESKWEREEYEEDTMMYGNSTYIPRDLPLDEDEQLEMIIDEGRSELEMFLDEFYAQLYNRETSEDTDVEGFTRVLRGILEDTAKNAHQFHLDKEKEEILESQPALSL